MTTDKNERKKILVVGLGPIGAMFAYGMKKTGCIVYGLDIREDYIAGIREKGIAIEGLEEHGPLMLDGVFTHIDEVDETGFDYVVVSVKYQATSAVVEAVRERVGQDCQIVVMQNGIDNEEVASALCRDGQVMRFVINFAGNIVAPGLVKLIFFHKPNYIGCVCSHDNCAHAGELARLATQGGFETEVTEDIKKYAWQKAILVASLAPVSAIMGMTMAEVMAMDETRAVVEGLLKEAIEVAGALGYHYGDDFFDECVKYLATAGPHKPSLLVDIENGSRTEIGVLNERIAHHGQAKGVPVPLNATITNLIKAKEKLGIKQMRN